MNEAAYRDPSEFVSKAFFSGRGVILLNLMDLIHFYRHRLFIRHTYFSSFFCLLFFLFRNTGKVSREESIVILLQN